MRILMVTTSWPEDEGDPSGHFVRAEARALEREGHTVEVVRPASGGAFGWPGVAARVRERPARVLGAASWVTSARRRLAREDADRIVAHWAVPSAWPIATASRGGELFVTSHGGDVRLLAALPGVLGDRIAMAVARRATRWTFVSESLAADLLRTLGARARAAVEAIARVEAAPIDLPDVTHAADARRRELGSQRVAVSVGRLVASKRVDRVLEHVAASADLDALVVVGDGPERARLERLARALGVDARFVGKVSREEALAWIAASTVVLHASEAEGLSTVLREAEALGTAVAHVGSEGSPPQARAPTGAASPQRRAR